jgi:hypothetical protein
MSDQQNQSAQEAILASKPKLHWSVWLPSQAQILILIIVALLISNLALWVRLVRSDHPLIVTVGVRELSQRYVAKMALSDITPQQAAMKTQMFLTVTQDTVRRAAANKNVLLLARECVLAGEAADITAEVEQAVNSALGQTKDTRFPTGFGALEQGSR